LRATWLMFGTLNEAMLSVKNAWGRLMAPEKAKSPDQC